MQKGSGRSQWAPQPFSYQPLPVFFCPTRSTLLLPALERMCSHRYPTRRAKNGQMARADTKGHFVTLIRASELVTNYGVGVAVPFRNSFAFVGSTLQTFAHFFRGNVLKMPKIVSTAGRKSSKNESSVGRIRRVATGRNLACVDNYPPTRGSRKSFVRCKLAGRTRVLPQPQTSVLFECDFYPIAQPTSGR
jgi:hypothetical protein